MNWGRVEFFVPGVPVPKGSAKAFYNKSAGKIIVQQDNRDRQKPWASLISVMAQEQKPDLHHGPMRVRLSFIMPRPNSHYGTGKNADRLKPTAPTWHTSKPDLDKLIRCVKDSLTGILWNDDSQVADLLATKLYGDRAGVFIVVEPIP
jgi:Holliday junction resolvase RusA-like endonuclease